ncbi:uncharacterized protein FYW47_017260 [Aplochiton taeniatus]
MDWQLERAELREHVSHLQDELAESHAEREELESRAQALTDRLSQTVAPSLSMSLRLEAEQREWRRKQREGREREARQALLIHKLQNKVVEYRDRCQGLEQRLKSEERQLHYRERRIRDEHSDSLESALIRLEEEQQRSIGLVELNSLLRAQVSQSGQVNEALREDLQKLTSDWSQAVEEADQRESEWQREKESLTSHIGQEQVRLMSLWSSVVTLRRHCHTLKTATDRDLWELRAEFSRLSSPLLSPSDARPPPSGCSSSAPPLSSTLLVPTSSSASAPNFHSTLGTFSLDELAEGEGEDTNSSYHDTSTSPDPGTKGSSELSSLLSVLAQAETALRWRHQELQEAEVAVRRLGEERSALEHTVTRLHTDTEELQTEEQQTRQELTHTRQQLASETEGASCLRIQLEQMERREEELKRENDRLRREREREEEQRSELERERQKRVQAELLESAQLSERESRCRQELLGLQGALEREQLDRARTEGEAADARDALLKSRERVLSLSSSETQLKRELEESRDRLEKMAALNQGLVRDKREISAHTLQADLQLSEAQSQVQALETDVINLRRQIKSQLLEVAEARWVRGQSPAPEREAPNRQRKI